ncbi:hypothetical protein LBMAG15_01840 [Actinomycetes bacterium]|nr:hypothetical protein LBMAG15_01840 [Actinomycetes bacterium]
MGRGRAKAKQTKVARELKYGGPQTDFDRLQAELAGSADNHDGAPSTKAVDALGDPLDDDPYAKYYEEPAD